MKIGDIVGLLKCEVASGENLLETEVHTFCGADMMSDVLAFVKDKAVLLTGLMNPQVVRTADMMDIICIVFVRGKKPGKDITTLAAEKNVAVLTTDMRMFEACGILYSASHA